jgi:hypothetical protein
MPVAGAKGRLMTEFLVNYWPLLIIWITLLILKFADDVFRKP